MNKNLFTVMFITISIASYISVRGAQAKTYYKWIDQAGRVHLTDHQPASKEAVSVKEVEVKERPTERPRGRIGSQKMAIGGVEILPLIEKLKAIVPGELNVGDTTAPVLVAEFLFMLLFFDLCLYLIARRTHTPYAWLSWIPLANVFPFVGAAGYRWYIGLFVLITPCLAIAFAFYMPSVEFVMIDISVVVIAVIIFSTVCWMRICTNLKSSKWLGLLMMLPYLNVLVFPYLAYKEQPVIKGVQRLRPTLITLIVWVGGVAAFTMLSPDMSHTPLFQALK